MCSMRAIFLIPILLLLGMVAAQSGVERSYYLGSLGDTPVQMELVVAGNTISGWYQLESTGTAIELDGRVTGDREYIISEISERDDTAIGGTFSGAPTLEPDLQEITITGTWSGPDGRELPFRLARVADYSILDLSQGRIGARRSLPYFVDARLSAFNHPLHADALAELVDFFEQGRQSLLTGELWYGWTSDENTAIRYLGADFLSARSSIYSYTGGAHGNHHHRAFNLQLTDGAVRPVALADLFIPGSDYLAVLSAHVLDDLRRQEAYDVVEGTITELTEDDLAVFTLSPAGIGFAFAPYQVGPYAQGSFFVTVPLEVIADHAAPGTPLAALTAKP